MDIAALLGHMRSSAAKTWVQDRNLYGSCGASMEHLEVLGWWIVEK